MLPSLNAAQKVLLTLNLGIVGFFTWYYTAALNYEFLAYAGTIFVITLALYGTLRWSQFSTTILVGMTIWSLLHMLGGSVMTTDGVLYAYRIFPVFDGGGDFYILKMDQVIHAFLYGVVGLMFWQLLRRVLKVETHHVLVAGIAIFAAAGFSIINEIIEFWAAVNIPDNGVGGYHNTVLDMIFNLAGAAIAVTGAALLEGRRNRLNVKTHRE